MCRRFERRGGESFINRVVASELVEALSGYVPLKFLAKRMSHTPLSFCELMKMAGVIPCAERSGADHAGRQTRSLHD